MQCFVDIEAFVIDSKARSISVVDSGGGEIFYGPDDIQYLPIRNSDICAFFLENGIYAYCFEILSRTVKIRVNTNSVKSMLCN